MTRYINFKSSQSVETVDQLDSKDFKTMKEFKAELNRLITEYRLTGMSVYISQRQAK